MLFSIFKHSIIFFMCFYSYNKICKCSKFTLCDYCVYIICSVILGLGTGIIKLYIPELSYFLPPIFLFICISIYKRTFTHTSFCISLTAYSLNILIYQLVALFISCISAIVFNHSAISNINYPILITSLCYPFFIILLFNSKRFSGKISFANFSNLLNWNIVISIAVLTILTFEQFSLLWHSVIRYVRVVIIAICLCTLAIWWRSQITKTYREKLRLLELKTLRTAKVENEAYITKLEAENKRLGTIIHKDNRIVNAMADSVCDYLSSSANSNTTDLQAKGQSLSDEINSIKTYRQELLCQGSQSGSSIPQTNQTGVDAIISFMVKEAASYGITMKFHFDGEFFNAKHFTATEMDFVHLLSDLLENAIIAARHANGKAIELSLQILKGTPAISVSDSGIPFEIETFMKLGACEASTHTDEGGTGIGLMDIWTFKKKYHASLVIEELDNSTYSKRLSILFDNRNKYLIISNRFQQIISNQTRSDMLVINSSTNELTELIDK